MQMTLTVPTIKRENTLDNPPFAKSGAYFRRARCYCRLLISRRCKTLRKHASSGGAITIFIK